MNTFEQIGNTAQYSIIDSSGCCIGIAVKTLLGYKRVNPESKPVLIDEASLRELRGTLDLAIKYLSHPDVVSLPFALPSSAVAKRADKILRATNHFHPLTKD